MKPKSIYLVDDHETVLMGLKLVLEKSNQYTIIGASSHPEQALEEMIRLQPAIAIIDYSLRSHNGIDLIRAIKSRQSTTKCILLSFRTDKQLITEAKEVGASAFISKGNSNQELLQIVERVGSQTEEGFIQIELADAKLTIQADRIKEFAFIPSELQVINKILEGMTTDEIAQALNKSSNSISTLRKDINKKIQQKGFKNFTEFTVYAVSNKLFH